jgi:hypothetical protein
MRILENKFISAIISLIIYFLGIFLGHKYWFSGDVKNGSGLLSLFSVLITCGIGIGIFVMFNPFMTKFRIARVLPYLGALATFSIMWFYHDAKRKVYLQQDGGSTNGIVIFRDKVHRGKTSGIEIRYKYEVGTNSFEKYDTNVEYIKQENIQIGDTLTVKYWNKNPNYHSYEKKK